ncbi:MAG: hypothetical protein GC153_04925 [Alphaproteobacteria bacterium]|nr:hypothetical protein [Alphaproteobacteria bacterium]
MRYTTMIGVASAALLITGAAMAAGPRQGMGRGMGMRGHMIPVMIAVLDANGDGAVSLDEFEAVQKRMFDRMDPNKDGKLEADEARPPMPMGQMGPPQGQGGAGMMDREAMMRGGGSGMMGAGAMGHGIMGMGSMMMMAAMDTNNDGAVSLSEMQAVHKRIFQLIDANKDGKVTAAEAETFFTPGK